ncbi:uncharacterized protein LOC143324155 isoform X7 [Chaetodon auriga]|uniref:uncharacterized protein LOC143324155 isoform X7 n=1 Tax=Chaetodon auriga TaxID=39042 RepID=UPI004032AFC6
MTSGLQPPVGEPTSHSHFPPNLRRRSPCSQEELVCLLPSTSAGSEQLFPLQVESLPLQPPLQMHQIFPLFLLFTTTSRRCSARCVLSLPLYRCYNCSIDLLAAAPLPNSRFYSSARPEREVMEKYIKDLLGSHHLF